MEIHKNTLLASMAFIFILASLTFISAADYSSCPMGGSTYGMMSGGYGSGFMLFGWVTYILVIALIVSAIYWLVKSANKKK